MRSAFDSLSESIVYQQLTGKAAATIFERVRDLFPDRRFGPSDILATPDDVLRSAGLSRAKAKALRDLAQKTVDGAVPEVGRLRRMSDDQIVDALTPIRGIGRWTVEMMLIFRLGRPDVLPVDDYGVRKGYAALHGLSALPTPKQLAQCGERWRPFRSVAAWYLWRAVDGK
jgi:3-methyladenine DNA glycosylase/8-oxoguanine DNA glycosylase